MSFIGAFGHKHPVSRTAPADRLAGHHQKLADLSRLVQIRNMIQQHNSELKVLKARLSRLEETLARGNRAGAVARETDDQPNAAQQSLPLPIAELKQLAEMAKRFR